MNETRCPLYNSGRLILNPENDRTYLEVEIVRSSSGLRMYANILFLQASPSEEELDKAKIEIFLEDDNAMVIYADILEGGQRLLFPKDAAEFLIQKLEEEKFFKITIERYQTTIVPSNFSKVYPQLMKMPIEERI